MSKHSPNPYIELSLFNQHGMLQIFLDNEASFLVSEQLLLQQFSKLINSLEKLYTTASIQIAWLQEPQRAFEGFIWARINKGTFPFWSTHILKVKERFEILYQRFIVVPYLLFFFTHIRSISLISILSASDIN